ncbi:MAG: Cell division protein FtsQ [Akkermansiaceae bacterium]|nr:Cell division protein FtsQ [Akkermansiaceae bacterium]
MFKRRTSKPNRNQQLTRLQAHVMSPRIAWFGFLGACSRAAKILLILGVLALAGYGIWRGAQRALFNNEEFRLQAIHLTPNTALDERRLVQIGNIDINGTLFDCNLDEIEKRLLALPEIESAEVKREFPGTLLVKVVARQPVVWVSSPRQDPPVLPRDPQSGLVVDHTGFAYRCPAGQLQAAQDLPVIELAAGADGSSPLVPGEKVHHPQYDRAMALHGVACAASPDAAGWIDTIRQSRDWSMEMTSHDGMKATFGLGDQDRQMQDLISAVEHSRTTGEPIASINLIPRNHLPVLLKDGSAPRAVLIADPDTTPKGSPNRRDTDLKQLINRR